MDTMLALGKVVAQRVKVAAIGSTPITFEELDRQSLETLQAKYPGGLVAPAASGGRTLGALLGGGLGALGGGAHGLAFPGRDEEGKERSRVREALKRALMVGIPGAVVGGLGGGALAGSAAALVERDIANLGKVAAQRVKQAKNPWGRMGLFDGEALYQRHFGAAQPKGPKGPQAMSRQTPAMQAMSRQTPAMQAMSRQTPAMQPQRSISTTSQPFDGQGLYDRVKARPFGWKRVDGEALYQRALQKQQAAGQGRPFDGEALYQRHFGS